MTRTGARLLAELADRVLPAGRAEWGSAMKAETQAISSDVQALVYALGCVAASVRERSRLMRSPAVSARLAMAVTTGGFAVFFLACGVLWLIILTGAPDPYYLQLSGGTADERVIADIYSQLRPAMTLAIIGLGSAHALGAFSIAFARRKPFILATITALAMAACLAGFFVTMCGASPAVLYPFAALVLQALLAPLAFRVKRSGTHPLPFLDAR